MIIYQAISKLKDGSLSAAELCEKCVTRAKRVRELNCIVTDNFSQSQREAVHSSRLWSEYGTVVMTSRLEVHISLFLSLSH